MNKDLTKQIGVYLSPEEFYIFEQIRWREQKTKAKIGRDAFLEYMKNHAEGNNQFKIEDFTDPNFRAMPAMASTREKWYHYVKKNTDRQERAGLKDITTYINKCIDAVNYEEDHPNA